jgi:hypothetical protein
VTTNLIAAIHLICRANAGARDTLTIAAIVAALTATHGIRRNVATTEFIATSNLTLPAFTLARYADAIAAIVAAFSAVRCIFGKCNATIATARNKTRTANANVVCTVANRSSTTNRLATRNAAPRTTIPIARPATDIRLIAPTTARHGHDERPRSKKKPTRVKILSHCLTSFQVTYPSYLMYP